tara:strand:+ start:235 stop:435 length:201 start_codon:yes stop_codon:yes gene_type:complete
MVVRTFTKIEPVFGGKVIELKIYLNEDNIVGFMKNTSDSHCIIFLNDSSRVKVKETPSEVKNILSS